MSKCRCIQILARVSIYHGQFSIRDPSTILPRVSRSEGEAERDIGSPCMIGPGLVVVEKFFRSRRHRRRRRRHLGVDLNKLGACIKI